MATLFQIAPTTASVEALWGRYATLALAYADNPELRTSRKHIENMARAERDFKAAALALEEKEQRPTQ